MTVDPDPSLDTTRHGFLTGCCATALLLIASSLAGCGSLRSPAVSASPAPTGASIPGPAEPVSAPSEPPAVALMAGYAFPAAIDPAARYLFYLHGKIIEDQGLPAVSPEFGEYEYEAILGALEYAGMVVISELRPRDAVATTYAGRIKDQVSRLKEAGGPSGHITVLGASKGAYIAALASFLIKDRLLNFVLLGTCYPGMISEWKSSRMQLYGNVLAIYDGAEDEYSGSCEELFQLSEGKGLGRHEQLVLHVGTGHGILYKPLDEWILPALEWASQ